MPQDDHATAPAGPPLWRASVPVLAGVLDRLAGSLDRAAAALGPRLDDALATRPAPGMLTAAQQVASTAQFAVRIAFPLAGLRPPELRGPMDGPGLAARIAEARALIEGLDPAAFAGAEDRVARGQAGFAEVHQAMAHVALKQAGVPLGKADFDGVHLYPEGFSFG